MTLMGRRAVRVSAAQAECSTSTKEVIRGGVLMVLRWFIVIPFVYLCYNVRGLSRSPWRRAPEWALDAGIVVANHPSAFFDLILCLAGAPKWTFFLHEHSRTRVPLFNVVVRLLRGVPVVRTAGRDALYVMPGTDVAEKREKTAAALSARLTQGHWVTIFPEGRSTEYKSSELKPLREGVAELALKTAASMGWSRPLRIYPVGFIYEDARYIGTTCTVRWGNAFDVSEYQEAYTKDENAAAQALLARIKAEIENAIKVPAEHGGTVREQNVKTRFFGVVYFFILQGLALLGLPFRLFGRLAARRPSEQAAYATSLWLMCMAVGAYISGARFVCVFAACTVVCTRAYVVFRRRRARL